ncbi:hypothetical protein E4U58_005091 [Claviceps cyperi]|nr:hypothetical protein E4U58_005091 [Claviceps cyperi]
MRKKVSLTKTGVRTQESFDSGDERHHLLKSTAITSRPSWSISIICARSLANVNLEWLGDM